MSRSGGSYLRYSNISTNAENGREPFKTASSTPSILRPTMVWLGYGCLADLCPSGFAVTSDHALEEGRGTIANEPDP
jgi:hypothetical protein